MADSGQVCCCPTTAYRMVYFVEIKFSKSPYGDRRDALPSLTSANVRLWLTADMGLMLSDDKPHKIIPKSPDTFKSHVQKWSRKKRWSDVSCPQQRSLQATQVCFPATADSAQFYLLCCQPGSVPTSLSARTSQLSLWCPCRLSAWPGQTIHMANRTC